MFVLVFTKQIILKSSLSKKGTQFQGGFGSASVLNELAQ